MNAISPIAGPSIYIQPFYPGASAETVENNVTRINEQKMVGLDKMLYLSATSDSAGASRIDLTFAPGTDPDVAWSKVQNKLQLAMPSLPEVVHLQDIPGSAERHRRKNPFRAGVVSHGTINPQQQHAPLYG